MVTSEWGTPDTFENGLIPSHRRGRAKRWSASAMLYAMHSSSASRQTCVGPPGRSKATARTDACLVHRLPPTCLRQQRYCRSYPLRTVPAASHTGRSDVRFQGSGRRNSRRSHRRR
jgi:hypothetical protein